MRVGGLFSGIGGMELGLQRAGMSIAWMCEIDPYCRRVLAKHWPGVPIYEDVRELTADAVEPVDLISGGFPCQPWSVAGQRRGAADDRDLWPQMHRLVAELRPSWMLGENVAGLIGMGLDRVLSDLEFLHYACRAFVVPACAVDAPHRRERVWVVANAEHVRCGQQKHGGHLEGAFKAQSEPSRAHAPIGSMRGGSGSELADAIGAGLEVGAGQPGHDGAQRQAAERSGGLEHAYAQGGPQPQGSVSDIGGRAGDAGESGLGDADGGRRREGPGEFGRQRTAESEQASHWHDAEWLRCEFDGKARRVKSGLRLLVTGLPGRVARLRALGNAVVPQVVEQIGRAILAAHNPPKESSMKLLISRAATAAQSPSRPKSESDCRPQTSDAPSDPSSRVHAPERSASEGQTAPRRQPAVDPGSRDGLLEVGNGLIECREGGLRQPDDRAPELILKRAYRPVAIHRGNELAASRANHATNSPMPGCISYGPDRRVGDLRDEHLSSPLSDNPHIGHCVLVVNKESSMKSVLLAATAALALMISAPADAGGKHGGKGYGNDRGYHSQSYGKKDRRDYGKRDYGRRDKHGYRAHKHGYGPKKDWRDKYNHQPEPEPTPEPTPEKPVSKPSAPAQSFAVAPQDTDDNLVLGGLFGGALSSDATTRRMVGQFQQGARTLDHIEINRDGDVITLSPSPEAEALPWYSAPVANW